VPVYAIILAAGEGSRMRSDRPKPLHLICGRPMVMHVIEALGDLDLARTVVVVGHDSARVRRRVGEEAPAWATASFVEQPRQHGTGDAAAVGLASFDTGDLDDVSTVLILPGDTPLLRRSTIRGLVDHHRSTGAAATVLTAVVDDPTGYGRVVRDAAGRVARIVEHRDATPEELAVDEVNTSIYCFRRSLLAPALRRIEPDNAQGEYYLTDVVGVLVAAGHPVTAEIADDPSETQGVNDRLQLSRAEAELRRRTNTELLRTGVTMVDPGAVYVDTTVQVGRDVTLFPGGIRQGSTVVGDGTELGPDTRLVDTTVGADCVVEQTTARAARIGDRAHVGPFASLGPGAVVADDTTTGAFYTADSHT